MTARSLIICTEVSNMSGIKSWIPPGKDCGLCGEKGCDSFLRLVGAGRKAYDDCPFHEESPAAQPVSHIESAGYPEQDVLGHAYDFVLVPLPGEISARKIVLPFRADLVDRMNIKTGDFVLGRPMGAGCPIPHVLQVIESDPVTGLLYTWVVGPKYSRGRAVKDVHAYHMIGFEGLAKNIRKEPVFGCRVTFLPGLCMMSLNHTGLVNMLLQKESGLHLRLEDIRILAGRD